MARSKSPGPREPNGRLSRSIADTGTDEVALRRAILAGPNGDPVMTTTAVGVIYCRYQPPKEPEEGAVYFERAVYDAALQYASLYESLFGRVTAGAQNLESCIGHAGAGDHKTRAEFLADSTARKMQLRYEAAQLVFKDYDDKVMYESVVVFNQLPEWVGVDGELAERLRREWFDIAERVAAAMGYVMEKK